MRQSFDGAIVIFDTDGLRFRRLFGERLYGLSVICRVNAANPYLGAGFRLLGGLGLDCILRRASAG